MMMAPPSSPPNWMPMNVATGIRALVSAWRPMTSRGGKPPDEDAGEDRKQHARHRQLERRRELLQDLLGDRLMAEERAAEVAANSVAHVIEVLDEYRTVEPKRVPKLGLLLP